VHCRRAAPARYQPALVLAVSAPWPGRGLPTTTATRKGRAFSSEHPISSCFPRLPYSRFEFQIPLRYQGLSHYLQVFRRLPHAHFPPINKFSAIAITVDWLFAAHAVTSL